MRKLLLLSGAIALLIAVGSLLIMGDMTANNMEHTHFESGVIVENVVLPTCENDGSYDEVVYCKECYKEVSRVTKTTNKLENHVPKDAVEENKQELTCTQDGSYDVVIYCSVCDSELSREHVTLAATGHKGGEPVEENRTGTNCTEYIAYDKVVYCTACNLELSRDHVTSSAAGHENSEPVEENRKDATCTTDGHYEQVIYCSVCHEEVSREKITITAQGHNESEPVKENVIEATCTSGGSHDDVIYCAVCNVEMSRKTTTVPELTHEAGEWEVIIEATCNNTGARVKNCIHCGIQLNFITIDKLEHTTGATVKENETASGCTSKGGYDEVTYCSTCHGEISKTHITLAELGHTYKNNVCTRCGNGQREALDFVVFDTIAGMNTTNTKTALYTNYDEFYAFISQYKNAKNYAKYDREYFKNNALVITFIVVSSQPWEFCAYGEKTSDGYNVWVENSPSGNGSGTTAFATYFVGVEVPKAKYSGCNFINLYVWESFKAYFMLA